MSEEPINDFHAGRTAAQKGRPATDCPFAFARVKVDQATFDREYKPRLDAWTNGWIYENKGSPNGC